MRWSTMNLLKVIYLTSLLFLAGCSGDPATGPVDVTWDRDNCDRCMMALSDRNHSAQVRGGKQHTPYTFDDIGCALLWLEEQSWKDDPATEIWVNNYHDGSWLNAREAQYVKITHTPMNYGFSAQPKATDESVDFKEMKSSVFRQEDTYHASLKARLAHRATEAVKGNKP